MAIWHGRDLRSSWLVVGADGVAGALSGLVAEVDVRAIETSALEGDLARLRPTVVILVTPPAQTADIEALATERRRRRNPARTVLLTAADDLVTRLAAPGLWPPALGPAVVNQSLTGHQP